MKHRTPMEDALFKRGFLIKSMENGYTLSQGSHQNDKKDLIYLLVTLSIEHNWIGDLLFIDEEINNNNYWDILLFPARNRETNTSMALGSWSNFTKRKHGPKTSTGILEPGVAILVKALSAVGISTVCSCDGHGYKIPRIDFASYHNAVWFEYLQHDFFKDLDLHYQWQIEIDGNGLAYLTAFGQKYNILLLQEDSSNMAEVLLHHDEEIRQLKLVFFDKDKKPTSRLLKGKDYPSTKKILEDMITKQKVSTLLNRERFFYFEVYEKEPFP